MQKIMTTTYTEEQMAHSFSIRYGKSKTIPGLGRINHLFRDIDCFQGRPDFLGIQRFSKKLTPTNKKSLSIADAHILCLLKPASPRTRRYLCSKTGFSARTVNSILGKHLALGYIKITSSNSYVLGKIKRYLNNDIIGMEFKLQDHKKAIFQAQQIKSYANISLIVVPPSQASNYDKYDIVMKRWGIGLAIYDPISSEFDIIKRPKKTKPPSDEYRIHTLLQLLSAKV